MECFSAILLFDAFSARKRNRVVHWITVTAVAFLNATLLNFAATTMPNYSKIVIVLALFFSLHRLLYTSNGIFSLYISIIFYATICCIVPPLLLLKPLYSTVWIVAAAADALLLVLAKIGVGIK